MSNLYMFAIMPPKDLEEKIQKERIMFSENYNCVKALKPPVHITIYEPFQEDDDFETKVEALQKWTANIAPFTIKLDNFAFFENPQSPVFIIKVIKDDPISQLRTGLLRELKKYREEPDEEQLVNGRPIPKTKPQPFNPHFTIGYRDVPPAIVPTIKKDYARRLFEATFLCDTIYLWKHNGKNWQISREYKLCGTIVQPLSLF